MNNRLPPKLIITVTAILYVFCCVGFAFAKEQKNASEIMTVSEVKQEQAGKYRQLGLLAQQSGDLVRAMSFYQKAIEIYPGFAEVYNDAGVVYEAMGSPVQAEESYLKAATIDPLLAGAYTNLALLYEGRRDLSKAEFYWSKRVEVGDQDDPWTQKAAGRLSDIKMSLSARPFADQQEQEVLTLLKDVGQDRAVLNQSDENLAQAHFKKAKAAFNKDDMATAIREALDAQYLDPQNQEIEAFIDKAERRALTR